MKILLLEDEYSLRISIKEFLEDLNYDVDDYSDGDDAYNAIYSNSYDLLLFDVNVPNMNGFEILKTIRDDQIKIPTIFLTSMTDIQSLKEGYGAGCCDYLRKPFDLDELELRIVQVYNSFYMDNNENITLDKDLIFEMKEGQLFYKDTEIVLRKAEKDILDLLVKNINATVSMGMFQDEIWNDYVDPGTIRTHIKNLKQKLPNSDLIKNRRGLGYIIERQ